MLKTTWPQSAIHVENTEKIQALRKDAPNVHAQISGVLSSIYASEPPCILQKASILILGTLNPKPPKKIPSLLEAPPCRFRAGAIAVLPQVRSLTSALKEKSSHIFRV